MLLPMSWRDRIPNGTRLAAAGGVCFTFMRGITILSNTIYIGRVRYLSYGFPVDDGSVDFNHLKDSWAHDAK